MDAHVQREKQGLGSKLCLQHICPRALPSGLIPGNGLPNSTVVLPFPWGWAWGLCWLSGALSGWGVGSRWGGVCSVKRADHTQQPCAAGKQGERRREAGPDG